MNGSKPLMARQTSVGLLPARKPARRLPSPRPSPSGRGGTRSRAGTIPDESDLRRAGLRISLSPRERAGVRGNETVVRPAPPFLELSNFG